MPCTVLRDDQWSRIEDFLLGKATDCGVTAKNNRLFVEAVLWIIRTGSPWRDQSEVAKVFKQTDNRYTAPMKVWITPILKNRSEERPLFHLFVENSPVILLEFPVIPKRRRYMYSLKPAIVS